MNANTLKPPQMDQSGGPKSSPTLNISTSQPSLRPMQRVGGNSVLPKPQVANGASGLAHPGGTADAMGAQDAMQRNMGHFHPSQLPAPQPMMNEQFQGMPLTPGGMAAKKMGALARRGFVYKDANWLSAAGKGLWHAVQPTGKAMLQKGVKGLSHAGSVADEVVQQLPQTGRQLGQATRRLSDNLANIHTGPAVKAAPAYKPHGDPIPVPGRAPGHTGPIPGTMITDVKTPGGQVGPTAAPPSGPGRVTKPNFVDPRGNAIAAPLPSASHPNYTISPVPGRGVPEPTGSAVASPKPSPVGRVDAYAGLGAEGGSSATNPALRGTSRGTRIQGKPTVSQDAGLGIGRSTEMPPVATELGDAAGMGAKATPAPKIQVTPEDLGTVAPAATELGRLGRTWQKAKDIGAGFKDFTGFGIGSGTGHYATSAVAPALNSVIPGSGTALNILGTIGGGVLGSKAMGKAVGWKAPLATLGALPAYSLVNQYAYGDSPAAPAGNEAAGAVTGTPPQAGMPGAEQPSAGALSSTAAPQQQQAPSSNQAGGYQRSWWQKITGGEQGYIDDLNKRLDEDPVGTVMNDPKLKSTYDRLIKDPRMRAQIAKDAGGPAGELFNVFTSLPPMAQIALVAALFMGVGGLMGGQSGALIGGAAGGLGALVLQNLPAITSKLKEWQGGTTDPVHANTQSNQAAPAAPPAEAPTVPVPPPAAALVAPTPQEQAATRPRPEITPSSGVGGF